MFICELHVHVWETYADEVYTCEAHAYEIYKVCVRYTPMSKIYANLRYMPVTYMPARYTPARYTPVT